VVILVIVCLVFVGAIVGGILKFKAEKNNAQQIETALKAAGFNVDKIIYHEKNIFAVDDTRKRIFVKAKTTPLQGRAFNYSDIIDYELVEDGHALMKGGAGKAVVGAALFGVAGAVVGSSMKKTKNVCTSMEVRISVSDVINSNITLNLISSGENEKSGIIYKSALEFGKEVVSTLAAAQKQVC